MTYKCQYCLRDFVRESSLSVHVCEQKKRHLEQNEAGVRLGLHAYLKFFELTQGSAKNKTFKDFASSPYYKAFVKFGRYCVEIKAVNPARFVEYVLKQNKKIDYWCSDRLYTEYLVEHLKVESVQDALARAIEYAIDWAEKTECPAHDCLRYGNPNAIIYAITAGRISAWVIYNSESGQKFLNNLTSEQLAIIWSYVDADVWQRKFKEYSEDQEYAQTILKQAGW